MKRFVYALIISSVCSEAQSLIFDPEDYLELRSEKKGIAVQQLPPSGALGGSGFLRLPRAKIIDIAPWLSKIPMRQSSHTKKREVAPRLSKKPVRLPVQTKTREIAPRLSTGQTKLPLRTKKQGVTPLLSKLQVMPPLRAKIIDILPWLAKLPTKRTTSELGEMASGHAIKPAGIPVKVVTGVKKETPSQQLRETDGLSPGQKTKRTLGANEITQNKKENPVLKFAAQAVNPKVVTENLFERLGILQTLLRYSKRTIWTLDKSLDLDKEKKENLLKVSIFLTDNLKVIKKASNVSVETEEQISDKAETLATSLIALKNEIADFIIKFTGVNPEVLDSETIERIRTVNCTTCVLASSLDKIFTSAGERSEGKTACNSTPTVEERRGSGESPRFTPVVFSPIFERSRRTAFEKEKSKDSGERPRSTSPVSQCLAELQIMAEDAYKQASEGLRQSLVPIVIPKRRSGAADQPLGT